MAQNPLGPPRVLHLENFANAWRVGEFNTTTTNSLILVVATVVSVLLFGGLAAYSLARLQPPGANLFMLYMLGGSTLPIWLFLVPLYFLFFPVTTSYYKFTGRFSCDWALTSAAAIMMIAPILVLFLALQRRFIEGLTQGGLKT